MTLAYPDKKSLSELLTVPAAELAPAVPPQALATDNLLLKGDNQLLLQLLRQTGALEGKVDLVYIDPPYATNAVFTLDQPTGTTPARVSTISRAKQGRVAYADTLTGTDFLEFLRERLALLHSLLAPTGSLYLHIDYKIGHYVKVLLDEIFGAENFRNDITRIKCNPKNFARKGYGNVKDMLLFYTKSDQFTWNEPYEDRADGEMERLFTKTDVDGRAYTTNPLHAPGETRNGPSGQPWRGILPPAGRHWRVSQAKLDELDQAGLIEWSKNDVPRKKIFAEDFTRKRRQDIWKFKDNTSLYPTQKNLDLLRAIIETSSVPGQTVLDCFAGSGTTLVAAAGLGRRWIGIDQSPEAINIIRQRLAHEGGLLNPYVFAEAIG